MATTRKILSKGLIKQINSAATLQRDTVSQKEVEKKTVNEVEAMPAESGEGGEKPTVMRAKKVCQFCSNKTEPHYFDMVDLRRFINDRGRIVARTRSGSCSKHQRRITKEIKRARHLALLPFIVKV